MSDPDTCHLLIVFLLLLALVAVALVALVLRILWRDPGNRICFGADSDLSRDGCDTRIIDSFPLTLSCCCVTNVDVSASGATGETSSVNKYI